MSPPKRTDPIIMDPSENGLKGLPGREFKITVITTFEQLKDNMDTLQGNKTKGG